MAATSGHIEAVEPLLDAAEHASEGAAEEPFEPTVGRGGSLLVNIPALIALQRSYLGQLRGDAEATAAFASQALAGLNKSESTLGSIAQGMLAVAEWLRGRLAEAEHSFVPSIAAMRAAGLATWSAWKSYELGRVQRAQGRLDAAALTCQQELENAAEHGHPPLPAAGPAYAGLADVAYQRNELDTALRHAREGIALCRQFVYTEPMAACLATLAWIRQASGNPAGAREAMGEAIQAAPGPPGLFNPVPAQRARLLLAQGDVAAAAHWAEETGLTPDGGPDYPREPGLLVLARVLLAERRPGARTAEPAACVGGRPGQDRQPHRGRRPAGTGAGRQR